MDKQAIRIAIEEQWKNRASRQMLKPKTAAYRKAEIEFFCGAMAAMEAIAPNTDKPEEVSPLSPPVWTLRMLCGRPVVE